MIRNPDISIVVPVYGCRDCLEALVDAVRSAFTGTDIRWECILVDDRGPDVPWPIILELSKLDERIRGIRLARNHGQHLAIWAGLSETRGHWVAVIDCDLQDDPAVIPRLYHAAVEQRVEAMIVNRGSWSDSAFRRFASSFFYRIVDLLAGAKIKNIGNFGLYSRRMVETLLSFGEQEVFLPMMVSLTGLKTAQLQIDRDKRAAGKSSYSFLRLLHMAIAIIVRFSDRPLKLSVIVGLLFSCLAALVSVVIVIGWLAGLFTVQGWTSTVLSLWFLSGLIMAVLGIHGFYMGQIFSEVKKRPRILVETTTSIKEDPS
jgi:dolichol-phosphate mannosyltransferase